MEESLYNNRNYYVTLDAFRKKNGLLQQDIADFLGTSRGYISMVEKGDSKLSSQKLDMLFNGAGEKNWDISDLVPAYSRLQEILSYACKKLYGESVNPDIIHGLDQYIPALISPVIAQKIKYGEIGITNAVADAITKEYPEISRLWILDGTGSMLLEPNDQPSELELLREEVRQLRASLTEYQEENKKLIDSLPRLIADEIEKRSEQSVSRKDNKI